MHRYRVLTPDWGQHWSVWPFCHPRRKFYLRISFRRALLCKRVVARERSHCPNMRCDIKVSASRARTSVPSRILSESYKRRNFRLNLNVQLSAAPRPELFDGRFTGNRRRRNNLFHDFFCPAIEYITYDVMRGWIFIRIYFLLLFARV